MAGAANITNPNGTNPNSTNPTAPRPLEVPQWVLDLPYDRDVLGQVVKVLAVTLVLLIMFSMGCHIDFKVVLNRFTRPVGIVLGLLCQFVWMPLLGFSISRLISLRPEHALGLLIIATTPGGSISNIFSYWSHGDVPLSISMTTCSTLAAFGMMPLNLYIYHRDTDYHIPYDSIALALATTVIPVLIGMAVRFKWRKVSDNVTKYGSRVAMFIFFLVLTCQFLLSPHMFLTTWRPYVSVLLFPAFGLFAGYITSTLLCQPHPYRRTIAIETGCQNVPIASGLIVLSFSGPAMPHMLLIPLLYGITSIFTMALFTASSRLAINCGYCVGQDEGVEEEKRNQSGDSDQPAGAASYKGADTGVIEPMDAEHNTYV